MLPDPRVKQVHKDEYSVPGIPDRVPTSINLAEATEIWKRAEEHMRTGTHDLLAFIGPEFQRLTTRETGVLREIHWLLSRELWDRIKNPELKQPTDEERVLILQLKAVIRFNAYADSERDYLAILKEEEQAKLKLTEIGMLCLPKDEFSCSICTTTFGHPKDDGEIEFPIKTSYGHIFGQRCLETWISDQFVNTCPICRDMVLPPNEEAKAWAIRKASYAEEDAARARGTPPWLLMLSPPEPEPEFSYEEDDSYDSHGEDEDYDSDDEFERFVIALGGHRVQ